MIKPNFFLIGAPKCGTTSLIKYLSEHPEVCVSVPKEPHYFLTDLPNYRQVKTIGDYESCFKFFGKKPKRIGEASTWYFYSKEAVSNILDYNPRAKLIVMLRDPVKMSISLFHQFVYGLEENVDNFEAAWNLQKQRKNGECIPKGIVEPSRLQYSEVCGIGTQLERVMKLVPNDQLKVIIFDEFITETQKIYREVLEFLELSDDVREIFPKFNVRKAHRFKRVTEFLTTNENLNYFVKAIKKKMNIKSIGLSKYLIKMNIKQEENKVLNKRFERHLIDTFSDEVIKIETLLDRKLINWNRN